MNKIIIVYELLGLIKDGNVPNRIKYQEDEYVYSDVDKDYQKKDGRMLLGNIKINYCLNEEVEILEEDKPIIEKIKMNGESFYSEYINSWIKKENSDAYCEYLSNKLNELIDYINKKEKDND